MLKLLVLGGISGSGKTYLRDELLKHFPEKYYKVKQVTTRPMRKDEDPNNYRFISKREYSNIEKYLIGKTEIKGNFYGSILDYTEERIGIIILDEKGIKDFRNAFKEVNQKVFYLVLDKPIDELTVRREGRCNDHLLKEKNIRDYADIIINLRNNRFASLEEVDKLVDIYL